MSIYSCDNNLSWEDLIALIVRESGDDLYVNVYDSGVDIDTLEELSCLHNLSPEDIIRMLITTDPSGNAAIRAVKIT